MFRAMFSPIIRSTWLYLRYLVVFTQVAAGCQPAATWVNSTCSWWTLSDTLCLTTSTSYTSNNLPRMKNSGCQCSFRLLMMGGVSPETCWASYKYGIIKSLIHCCILFDFSLWIVLWWTDPRTSNLKINFVFSVQEDFNVFSLFVYVIRKNSGIPLFVLFNYVVFHFCIFSW
jgi:hypothetical protein